MYRVIEKSQTTLFWLLYGNDMFYKNNKRADSSAYIIVDDLCWLKF